MGFGRYTAQPRHLLAHMPRLRYLSLKSKRGLPGSGSQLSLERCQSMSLHEIECYITSLPGVTAAEDFGYRFFFYATVQALPFVTLAESDNEYDSVSNLSRDGVFRVNIGVGKDTFKALFPEGQNEWDYAELNRFIPHPHYAAQNFVCVLNPTGDILTRTIQYIEEAHVLAKRRFEKKQNS